MDVWCGRLATLLPPMETTRSPFRSVPSRPSSILFLVQRLDTNAPPNDEMAPPYLGTGMTRTREMTVWMTPTYR